MTTPQEAAREALAITRDDLERAMDFEYPEPTAEHVWGHLEAFTEDRDPDAARAVVALLDGDTLDAAWREAEAALPDGWFIGLLVWAFPSAVASPEVAWTASAADYSDDDGPAASGTGPTPTAALRALAARLREKP